MREPLLRHPIFSQRIPRAILPRSIVYYLVSGALLACSKLASRLPAYHLECMSRQSNGMLYSLRAQCPPRVLTPQSAEERLSGARARLAHTTRPGGGGRPHACPRWVQSHAHPTERLPRALPRPSVELSSAPPCLLPPLPPKHLSAAHMGRAPAAAHRAHRPRRAHCSSPAARPALPRRPGTRRRRWT